MDHDGQPPLTNKQSLWKQAFLDDKQLVHPEIPPHFMEAETSLPC